MTMARPNNDADILARPHGGHLTVEAWLASIRQRRAANPTRTEIQAAITDALAAGLNVSQISAATGIARTQFYPGAGKAGKGYDLETGVAMRPPGPKTCCCEWPAEGGTGEPARRCVECDAHPHSGRLPKNAYRCATHAREAKAAG